jgi:SAM-dependent methyltransferase
MPNDRQSAVYKNVTETPDTKGSREQIARLYSRYKFATDICKNKVVVEVACGAGLGLGYLARFANKVVGGDIDENNLQYARTTYAGRDNIEILPLDAHKLPFNNMSVDVVLLYEAIYYLPQPDLFVREAHRILRDDGVVIICSANKDWDEFNPSPFSFKYYSAPQLYSMLSSSHFTTELYGECLVRDNSLKSKITGAIKKGAVKFHLMPKTMKGKELLKRIFFGKLISLPPEITEGMTHYIPPVPISHDKPNTDYKVLFAVGKKT